MSLSQLTAIAIYDVVIFSWKISFDPMKTNIIQRNLSLVSRPLQQIFLEKVIKIFSINLAHDRCIYIYDDDIVNLGCFHLILESVRGRP